MSKTPLIIGIDPGYTSAVVGINFDKNLEFMKSEKEFKHDEMILEIINNGQPVLIATDRKEMPSTVDEIATSLGAKKFSPSKNLTRNRKDRIGRGENSHEKDAYASAIHAFNQFDKQIRKIKEESSNKEEERLEIANKYFK